MDGSLRKEIKIDDILATNVDLPFIPVFNEIDSNKLFEDALHGTNPLLKEPSSIEHLDERYENLNLQNKNDRARYLIYFLDDLIQADPSLKKHLVNRNYGYDFDSIDIDIAAVQSDFNNGKLSKQEFDRLSQKWLRDYAILLKAFEEILVLIYKHPILRKIIRKYNYENESSSLSNRRDSLGAFRELTEDKYGFKTVLENHSKGFRGSPSNNGSLFVNDNEEIYLKLDNIGKEKTSEYLHEYAAFLIIDTARKSTDYRKIFDDPEVQLQEDKVNYLHIVLLLLDKISQNPEVTKRILYF